MHGGKRGIVLLADRHAVEAACHHQLLHAIENHMDVDGAPLQRTLIGEDLHLVDELADAIGLITDQAHKAAVGVTQ